METHFIIEAWSCLLLRLVDMKLDSSTFPNAGMAEVGDLIQELTKLVCQREKETRDRHAQQVRWIRSLENHVRELNFQLAGYQHAIHDIDSRLQATRLLDPQPVGTRFLGAHYRSS